MASPFEDRKQSGSLAAAQAAVTISMPATSVIAFQVTGTFTATVTFEVTVDETNWIAIPATNLTSGARATTATTTGIYVVNAAGARQIRARVSAYTSGTAVITANASTGVLDGGSLTTSSGGGSAVDTELPAAAALGDTDANPTTPTVGAVPLLLVQGGTTLFRQKGHDGSLDARGTTIGGAVVQGYCYVWNGTAWDRARSANGAANTTGTGLPGAGQMLWDGTNWQKEKGLADGTQLISGFTTVLTASVTRPSDTNAYAAGDQVSNSTSAPTIITFTGAARVSGGTGVIVGAQITDSSLVSPLAQLELWLFDTTATPNNDNAAFAPSDATANTVVAVIPLTVSFAGTLNVILDSGAVNIPFVTVGSANLFGMLVVRNAYVPTSAEIFQIRLKILQD